MSSFLPPLLLELGKKERREGGKAGGKERGKQEGGSEGGREKCKFHKRVRM